MKLLTSTSSIRRTASKAWRSCSPHSASKWPDSLASSREAGWTTSPRLLEELGDRRLGEPLDLEVGALLAHRVGDGQVAPDVTEPDRRGEEEHAGASSGVADRRRRGGGRSRTARSTSALIALLTTTGWRAIGRCPEPSRSRCSAPVHSTMLRLRPCGWQRSAVPCTTSTGAEMPRSSRSASSALSGNRAAAVLGQDDRARGLAGEADDVLELLGRVRLGQHLVEEELGVVGPVLGQVVAVVAHPPGVVVELLVEVPRRRQPDGEGCRPVPCPRPDRHHPEDALGVQCGGEQGLPRADADADEHGALDGEVVHHGQGVGDQRQVAVRLGVELASRAAVAGRVDGDHPEVLGEVGHLPLPRPAVDARVDRHEQHGRVGRVVERLPGQAYAGHVDVPGGVRLPCSHGVLPCSRSRAVPGRGCGPGVAARLQSPCNRGRALSPGPASTRDAERGRPP